MFLTQSIYMVPYWQGIITTTDASTYSSVEGMIPKSLLGRSVSIQFLHIAKIKFVQYLFLKFDCFSSEMHSIA
jgi:hypothetical protein